MSKRDREADIGGDRQRKRDRKTDGETDRQTDRQTDRDSERERRLSQINESSFNVNSVITVDKRHCPQPHVDFFYFFSVSYRYDP